MKRYLWYTDLVLSTLGAYLGNLLGDKFNLLNCHPVLERYGQTAVFTYSMTHVYVDPKVGNRPVKSLSEHLRRNLERVRAQ